MNASEHFLRYAADCEQSRRPSAEVWCARPRVAVRALPDKEGTCCRTIICNALDVACLRGKSSRAECMDEPTGSF
jgi:hypothetical protein